MNIEQIELNWNGPYAITEHPPYDHYQNAVGTNKGVYCWCVRVDGMFLPTYIGSASGTIGVSGRLKTEISNSLRGRYEQLLDVDEFEAGRRLVIHRRFPDPSEKRGENDLFHKQHLIEYKAVVDASVFFFLYLSRLCDKKIVDIEHTTIARVQNSGLDVVPSRKPERGGTYKELLSNEKEKDRVRLRVSHACDHTIRGLT